MVTAIKMADLGRQKRLTVDVSAGGGELAPGHSIGQAIDYYRDRMQVPDRGLPWTAFSRGVMLDSKMRIDELEEADSQWTVMPEVSAG